MLPSAIRRMRRWSPTGFELKLTRSARMISTVAVALADTGIACAGGAAMAGPAAVSSKAAKVPIRYGERAIYHCRKRSLGAVHKRDSI